MLLRVRRFIEQLEQRRLNAWSLYAAATFVACLRMLEEYVWVYVPRGVRRDPMVWLGHTVVFYLALISSVGALLHLTLAREWRRTTSVVAAGFVLALLPPIIDVAVYGPGNFGYEYHSAGLATLPWHFYEPPRQTPLGETVTLWLSLALVAFYAQVAGAGWRRTLVTVLGHYVLIVFYLAVLPNWAAEAASVAQGIGVNETIGLLLTAAALMAWLAMRPEIARRSFVRLPHVMPAPALVLLGSAWLGEANGHTALAALVLALSALVFALHNDYYDRSLDRSAAHAAVVEEDDVVFLALLPVGLWLTLGPGHFWVAALALLFTIVGFAYNADPMRLKCVFPLSYKTEGLLGFLCLTAGVLTLGRRAIEAGTVWAVLLAAGGVSVGAMVKDAKDLADDERAGVRTIYVVLTRRGWSARRVDMLVGTALGVCLGVPVAVLGVSGDVALPWLGLVAVLAILAVAAFLLLSQRRRAVLLCLGSANAYLVALSLALLNQ